MKRSYYVSRKSADRVYDVICANRGITLRGMCKLIPDFSYDLIRRCTYDLMDSQRIRKDTRDYPPRFYITEKEAKL